MYRYGFNGKENDNEVKGTGNQQDYGFRIYDPRLGRFLSVDPLTKDYPWYTPYQFAGNKPIVAVDVDGLEEYIIHYKYEDGKATLLRKIDNGDIRMVGLGDNMKPVVYDKRTGKPMTSAELGKVQYQYYDASGNRVLKRRDYKGNYVDGDNELMPIGANNLLGSIYIGPNNPTYKDASGETKYDYRREPQDEVDAAAMRHDMNYDLKEAAGAGDAFFNRDIAPADRTLVNSANKVIQKSREGALDSVTGKPVSPETASRAKVVRGFFGWILSAPAFKGELPKGDVKPGPHNIK